MIYQVCTSSRHGFRNTSKTEIKDASQLKGEEDSAASALLPEEAPSVDESVLNLKFNVPKIIRGYSGLIPTKFRKLTEGESEKLKLVDAENLLVEIQGSIVIEPKKFVQLAKTCVAQELHHILVQIVSLLSKFPQFIPYTLDIIKKHENIFSDQEVLSILEKLNEWLVAGNASEFILVYIVRFFGSGRFTNKPALFEYFRSLRRNEGSYTGRAVLEQLECLVNRGEVLEIRDYYSRADLWEKRQIAKMVDIHLSEGEKRPFFKNILSLEEDIFLNNTLGFFSKEKNSGS